MDVRFAHGKVLHWKGRSHRFTPHFHTEFYAGVIVRGYCEFEASSVGQVAGPGDLVLINPFEVHTAGCSPDVEYRAIYFDDFQGLQRCASGAAQFLSCTATVVRHSPLAARLAQALGDGGSSGNLSSCLEEIVDEYMEQKEPALDLAAFQAEIVAALDRAHEAEEPAPISQLAAQHGMSAQHFSRVFHRLFGVPAVFFRNQLRLHRAEQRLGQGAPASEVALECGYSDQAHLIRELKKVRGVTPKLYATAYRFI